MRVKIQRLELNHLREWECFLFCFTMGLELSTILNLRDGCGFHPACSRTSDQDVDRDPCWSQLEYKQCQSATCIMCTNKPTQHNKVINDKCVRRQIYLFLPHHHIVIINCMMSLSFFRGSYIVMCIVAVQIITFLSHLKN